MTTQRLRPTFDLNIGDQEVLQRILSQPMAIADALASRDVHEHARIVGVIQELSSAFADVFFQVIEQLPDAPAQEQSRDSGMSR